MKIVSIILFILLHDILTLGKSAKTWYAAKMMEVGVPAYRTAYTTVQKDILDPFLTNFTVGNATTLNTALDNSQKLRKEAEQKVFGVIAAVKAKKTNHRGKQMKCE